MDNNNILQKLDGLESRYEEVSTLITDPNVISDQQRFVKLTKEYKDLEDIMKIRRRYIDCLEAIAEAKDILVNESDPDMKEMAREQLAENEALQPSLEEEVKIALIPKDPEDAKNVQMEIRAGTGGDEACLFAGDLFQMYKRFCETKGWQLSVTDVSEGAVGGFKEIDFAVSGDDVYGVLKYESGVHRVQRVPVTESNGRMQTSAATVAVLPEADPFEVSINEGEIKWDTFRSSGAGGQNVNKVESGVRARYMWKNPNTGETEEILMKSSSSVLRLVTSQRTRNVLLRVCVHISTIVSIRSMLTILQTVVSRLSLLVTALQRFVHTTSHRDVLPITVSAILLMILVVSSVVTSSQ